MEVRPSGEERRAGDVPDPRVLNEKLVLDLLGHGAIRSAAVEAAFRAVPRHLFLPGVDLERVYSNEAIVTRSSAEGQPISSSSQPGVMAPMLEQLDVRQGMRILEVGTGTGYNAALLAELVGESGSVSTIDIDDEIVAKARERLAGAGYERVRTHVGDGWLGLEQDAPYDRIEVTVGMWDLSPHWSAQLREGGILVVPLMLGRTFSGSVAFQRQGDRMLGHEVVPVGFMTLRGPHASPAELAAPRGTTVAGWWTSLPAEGPGTQLIAELLAAQPHVEWERTGGMETFWLGDQPDVIYVGRPRQFGVGLMSVAERGMALIEHTVPAAGPPTHRLLSYGSRGPLDRLQRLIPRSALRDLRIDALPTGSDVAAFAGLSVRRPHYTFRFWRPAAVAH